MSLTLTTDRALIRATGRSTRHVVAAIEAPLHSGSRPRLPLNLALVIDRSGSMGGDKIAQARDAACYVAGQLSPRDRLAVVAYDDIVEVLVPSTLAMPDAIAAALRRIARLNSRGTTDLSGGWLSGCREIADFLDGEQIARCLLLTDGLANRGIVDQDVLCTHAEELRARGIVTSTFGIGRDFDEVRLSALAEAGGGTFRLIRDAEEIPGLIREELKEGLEVVAPQAVLEVTAPGGVAVSSLNGFALRADVPGVTRIQLGDLVSGQVLEPIIALQFPPAAEGASVSVSFRLTDRDGALDAQPRTVSFEYAGHRANDAQPRNRTVDRRVAATHAARSKREALTFNRDGNFAGAARAIERCLERIRSYAGGDPELNSLVTDLGLAKGRMGRDMEVMARKNAFSHSSSDLKLRHLSGASVRRVRGGTTLVVPCSQATARAVRTALDALGPASERLLGTLRASESWPQFQQMIPNRPQLTPVEENTIVDLATARWEREGLRIVLTPAQLPDNWYSHWHAAGRTAVVSLYRSADLMEVELAAYLAYEILLHGLHTGSPHYDMLRLAHEETRGCVYDLCGDKRDMEVKLQALHLCSECSSALGYLGINIDAVAAVTDIIRDLARPVRSAVG